MLATAKGYAREEGTRLDNPPAVALDSGTSQIDGVSSDQAVRVFSARLSDLLMLRPVYISAHSYALLPLGALGKWTTSARLVYDTHELETEVEGMAGIRKRAAKWIERCFIRCADLVLVVSEPIADWYAETYSGVDPVLVMNCPPLDALADSDVFRDTHHNLTSDTSIVLYQGFRSGRGRLEKVVELFDNDPPENAVLVLMGYGALEEMLRERAAANPHTSFLPGRSRIREDLPRYSASADIGLCT